MAPSKKAADKAEPKAPEPTERELLDELELVKAGGLRSPKDQERVAELKAALRARREG